MRAVILSHSDREGGAAIAAHRLLEGLDRVGVSARMLVARKLTQDPRVVLASPEQKSRLASRHAANFFHSEVQRRMIDANRSTLSDTLFSFPYPSLDVSQLPLLADADVVNCHWVNGFLSPAAVHRILQRRLPVVWSLHDMWPFTGGCHYSAGCEGFVNQCKQCPQLRIDDVGVPEAALRDKLACLAPGSVTVVALSRWIKQQAERSAVLGKQRIELIPNGVDSAVFHNRDRDSAKRELGLKTNDMVLMFGATHGRSLRKGFDLLSDAITRLKEESSLLEKLGGRELVVLSLGHPSPELKRLPLRVIDAGFRTSDGEIAAVYRAADVFVLPSREDNLPNTVMEAMACGCVPVAFDVGGTTDLFADGVEGLLVPAFDTRELGKRILQVLLDEPLRNKLSRSAAARISREFTLERQGRRYEQLFADLGAAKDGCFSPQLAGRYAAPTVPYPSPDFAGPGGALYRILLFSYYSRLSKRVDETPTRTLLFILIRRTYRRLAATRVIGPVISGLRRFAEATGAYTLVRRRLAPQLRETDQ